MTLGYRTLKASFWATEKAIDWDTNYNVNRETTVAVNAATEELISDFREAIEEAIILYLQELQKNVIDYELLPDRFFTVKLIAFDLE